MPERSRFVRSEPEPFEPRGRERLFRSLGAGSPGQATHRSVFRVHPVRFSEETEVEVLDESSEQILTDDERRIVDFVAEEYAFVSATELGVLTKRMNPAIRSWGGSRAADLSEDAYERMSPEYLEMAESVAEVSLDQLRKESRPVASSADVIA